MLDLSNEVKQALEHGQPVVALESTIIAHGFPYPTNYDLALELEADLRKLGVVPATIAILEGRLKVGLTADEIHYLAKTPGIRKASLRDLPVLAAMGFDGATTVATTMQVAHLAGIKVFVTGGIGGVHRGAAETFDISADLKALAAHDVMVVCAGAKSVLDLPKTLEVLESQGTTVLGYQTEEFPAFYLRDSGLKVDCRVDSCDDIVRIWRAKEKLGIPGGLLVTAPIPTESELNEEQFSNWLATILAELAKRKVGGKDVTPYLLGRLHELSDGATVKANIALVKNNLQIGARLARDYCTGAN